MDIIYILIAAAVLPGIYLIGFVYNHDRIEKEPFGLLIKLLIIGVFIAVPIIIFEELVDIVLMKVFYNDAVKYVIADSFLCAALVEECFKYLGLKLGSWKNKAFDYRFDGIVYAICVGLGFAILENVLYVLESGIETAILRALTSMPGHAIFALYMGHNYGLAKQYAVLGNKGKERFHKFKAVFVPIMLHGAYDTLAFLNLDGYLISVFAFVIIAEIIAVKNIKKYSKQDKPFMDYTYLNTYISE